MSRARFGLVLILPALTILTLFALVPIAGSLFESLHHRTAAEPVARFAGLDNYARLLRDEEAVESVGFTMLFVGTSVSLELGLGLAIALVLHQAFRGRGLVRAAVLVPWAIPTVVASIIWKYVFDDRHGILNYLLFGADLNAYLVWLADPFWAKALIISADVWKTTPFTALLLLAGLQTVPGELVEAARVDGAGPLRRFFVITLPLLRPAILVALLFRTMDAFREFELVYELTQGKEGTSVLQFYGYKVLFGRQDYGFGSAISCLVFFLIAIVAFFYVRTVGTRLFEEAR
ncbi:MAG: sugar ABC transporter permease [Planctomycetes bacterium]|nr:sugar ABC transporter permease [Planctomycetota bacterium]